MPFIRTTPYDRATAWDRTTDKGPSQSLADSITGRSCHDLTITARFASYRNSETVKSAVIVAKQVPGTDHRDVSTRFQSRPDGSQLKLQLVIPEIGILDDPLDPTPGTVVEIVPRAWGRIRPGLPSRTRIELGSKTPLNPASRANEEKSIQGSSGTLEKGRAEARRRETASLRVSRSGGIQDTRSWTRSLPGGESWSSTRTPAVPSTARPWICCSAI